MTHNKLRLTVTAVVLLVAVLANTQPATADVPQMINYQGRLTDTSGNAYCHDTATIVFAIYSDPDAVTSLWTETQLVSLHYGLFSVRLGDLTEIPTSVFDGSERWLGISPAAGTEILPRTLITSQAYAYHAHHADTAEYALASPGSNSCNWYVLDSVIFTDKYWGIARGGAGNVLYGDSQHTMVNMGVACTTGTFGESHAYTTVGGGRQNVASSYNATVSGGLNNAASGFQSTVGGGYSNQAGGWNSVVAGGFQNTADGANTSVGGGGSNVGNGDHSVIGGGHGNRVDAPYSTIPGGSNNTIHSVADHSYLLGIGSELSADSTFRVEMPHIVFGNAGFSYEFPVARGADNQVMVTDGSGQLSWTDPVPDEDWTINGDDMYSAPSGNVGVGATNPQSKLDVGGDVRTSGNMGVGKAPSTVYELDVAGDIRADEDVVVTDNLSVYDGKLVVAPTGTAVPVGYKLYVKGQMRTDSNLIVDERVGIGTTNPTTTLYVDGNIRFKFDFFGRYSLSAGSSQTITHNLSGEPDSMVVFIHGESSGYSGRHQCHLGSAYVPSLVGWRGVEWYGLTGTQITIARGDKDNRGDAKDWDYVYVRIIKNQ